MPVTGSIRIDLTDVEPMKMRHRAAILPQAPDGARVVLVVSALAVEPEAVRAFRPHVPRLHFDVHGEPYAVRRWVLALRHGMGELIA